MKCIRILFAALLFAIGSMHAAEWIDLTEQYIVNPTFKGNDLSTGWMGTPYGSASPYENAEHYSKNFDTYQTIEGLAAGHYRVSVKAFYRMGSADTDYYYYNSGDYAEMQLAQLYASTSDGEAYTPIAPASSAALETSLGGEASRVGGGWWSQEPVRYIPNNMEAAHLWFEAGHYHNEVEIDLPANSTLRIGVRKSQTTNSDWMCLDDWRIEMYGERVAVKSIRLNTTQQTLDMGGVFQLAATVLPSNATIQKVQWTTSNAIVASVDETGMVIGESEGTATITATATDGSNVTASCVVNVNGNGNGLSDLTFTEIQSANLDQTVDPSWNYGGWVEVYNSGNKSVSLRGCWVSDDANNLQKVHISQNIIVPEQGYKNLWFDHHDKYCLTQVNMKLDVEGGTVYLSDPNGNVIASKEYPPAVARCSYARKSLAGNEWAWTSTPTPEAENTDMKWSEVRLPAPTVDKPTQVFDASLNVCVNIPEGATLIYTTDCSTPTEENGEVSDDGLFSISETTTLRLCLVGEGYLPSPVVTRTYILKDKTFDLPVISVVGNHNDLYGNDMGIMVRGNGHGRPGNGQSSPCNWNMDWDRTVNFEYMNQEGKMVINQETAMERCGGWSRAWTPYAFKIKANKQYELQNTLPYRFFSNKPYRKHKTLQIRNGGNDNVCRIKDPALQEIIFRSGIDLDCQGYEPVMHYINGQYAGVINMREPNNKHYIYANYGLDDDEIDQFEMSPDSGYVQKCGTYESMQRWYDLAAECEDDEVYEEIKQMVDIDEYCNYMAVQFYLCNWDWPQNNVKGWKPIMEGGKYRFIVFDLDGSQNPGDAFNTFARKQTYTFDRLYGEPVSNITKEIEFVTIFLNMLQNEHFRKQFIDTYCLVTGSVFEPTRCRDIINELASRVATSQNISNNVYWQSSTPWSTANSLINSLSASRQTSMMNTLKNFSPLDLYDATPRNVKLSTNLAQARLLVNDLPVPTNTFSGQLFAPVTLKAQAPTGYKFTGWKLIGGTNPTYAEVLLENESEWDYYDQGSLDGQDWTSDTYNASSWASGQAPLGYFVGGDRYTNTYLDYGNNTNNKRPTYYFRRTMTLDKELEEGDAVNLSYIVDDGFVVYVNGQEAGRYNMPGGPIAYETLATSYAQGNPDSGTLTLPDSLFRKGDNLIAVEVHNNQANSTDIYWEGQITLTTQITEGSIVSTEETFEMPDADVALQACYEAMSNAEKQEAGLTTCPIVINEISAGNSIYVNEYGKKDDWIELYNTTNKNVDIEGMYLTDQSDQPEKYQITGRGYKVGTVIPPHGYKIIWCSKRNTDTELHANFKLNNEDGSVIRIMAKNKSWADSIVYCAHNGDQTVGRYPDGGNRVYLMTQPTIKAANLLNTYAKEWIYTKPDTIETRIQHMSSRDGGMSIAYYENELVVKSEDNPHIVVTVYAANGALAMRQPLNLEDGHERMSISALPAGIYVARAKDNEGNECATKFIKR